MRIVALLMVCVSLSVAPAVFALGTGASLGDTVWYDTNANGVMDTGEAGIPGVTVTADRYDSNGALVYHSSKITDGNGYYLFPTLLAGTYHVTTSVTGLSPTYDLDGVGTPSYAVATLATGQARRDVDFGYVAGTLGDTVWADANANGVQDSGETGLAGVSVSLYDGSNTLLATTTTNSSGWYSFNSLASGVYTVKVDPATLSGGWVVPTYDLDGLDSANSATGSLGPGETRLDFDFGYTKTGSLGDYVWFDADQDGVQDAGEQPIPHVTLILLDSSNQQLATTATDDNGLYTFGDLLAGTYKVQVDAATLPPRVTQTYDLDGIGTANIATATLALGQNRTDVDFGYYQAPEAPGLSITKEANVTDIVPGQSVTYTYTITTTGGQTLSYIVATDDAATPKYTPDDFIVGQLASLAAGQSVSFTATKSIAVDNVVTVNGTNYDGGWETTEVLPNGDVRFTYVQSLTVTDNTYGATASPGWPSGHKFGDLTGSDKAQFLFKNAAGTTVMQFYLDYISASTAFPSGYGTLGATGGDGSMVVGSASNIASYTTSMTLNMNQSPAYYVYTVNSPVNDPNWNYYSMYTMVIKAAAFGTSGFGSAEVVDQHNSPSKLGVNAMDPKPVDSAVTNTVVVTGTAANGTAMTASATETVWIWTHGRASLAGNIWADLNENGSSDGYDWPMGSVTVTLVNVTTGATVGTAVTDAGGNYTFAQLYPGTYRATVTTSTLPAYYTKPTYDLDGISTANTAVATIVGDTGAITNVNFGYNRTAAAPFTTYTPDRWGGTSTPRNAGWMLDTHFATLYPSGLVVGGGYTVTFASAAAVDTYLPRTGTPAMLTQNWVNPTSTPSNELVGQTTALKLNVDYSSAGLLKSGLGSKALLKGELMGWTVDQVLAAAQATLGGNRSGLPSTVTLSDLNSIIKSINGNYLDGTKNNGYLSQ
ncbi:MAG: SdrD B-like domain-containing protein [Armatimonadia bacterium]